MATPTATPPAKKTEKNSATHVQNHKTIASNLEAAAKHHTDAAKHHEAGNPEKAAHSTVKANGHQSLANDAKKEDAKLHASKI